MALTVREDQFWWSFSQLSAFNILSNLMVPLAGLIDVAFLGHLPDISHLAGVALATVIFNWLYWSFGFLRMATTGLTAQAIGRQDKEEVLLIALRSGLIAVTIGILIVLMQQPIRSIGFAVLSADPAVELAGQSYYNALIWGAPAQLLDLVLLGWFLGRGQGGKVLALSAVNNITNVTLNYCFVVQLHWESAGAGYATALAQASLMCLGLFFVLQEVSLQQLRSLLPKALQPDALRSAILLNKDILIRTFAFVLSFSLFTGLSATLGTPILAANTLLLQVVTLSAYFIDGIAFATESYAGQLRGQQSFDRLLPLLRNAGGVSLCIGLCFASLFNVFPRTLFGLLTTHDSVLQQVQHYSVWLFPVLGFGAIAYLLDGYFLGLTEGKILRNASLMSAGVGFLPAALAAWYLQNPHLLWVALVGLMLGRGCTLSSQVPKTLYSTTLVGDR